ncbi:hypothetical protein AQJ58_20260 [Streptomyces sp. DSM 15324]|nr:hypothetical protein AQJ58_20260 [Streptomyces sp. DSM 15324]
MTDRRRAALRANDSSTRATAWRIVSSGVGPAPAGVVVEGGASGGDPGHAAVVDGQGQPVLRTHWCTILMSEPVIG